MKILITGATGFIGSRAVSYALSLGCDVIASSVDDVCVAKKHSWFDKVCYIKFDITNYTQKDLFSFFNKPDILMHLAWSGLPNYNSLHHIEENLFPSYFFVKNLAQNGLKNVCGIGTCFEYGLQEGCMNEELNAFPVTAYSKAKNMLMDLISELNKTFDFSFKWIRLFYLYGDENKPNTLLGQLNLAIKNKKKSFDMSAGEQIRDYLHVDKVAEYIVNIALQNKITGIINCCSGKPISIRRFVENYMHENDLNIRLNFGAFPYSNYEPLAFWGNTNKLKKILDL